MVSNQKKTGKKITSVRTVSKKKSGKAQSKKTTSKKSAAKKTSSKKSPAKKSPAKKTSSKKSAAKKTSSKKSAAKKTSSKKSTKKAMPSPPGNIPGKPIDLPYTEGSPQLNSRPITPGVGPENLQQETFVSGYDENIPASISALSLKALKFLRSLYHKIYALLAPLAGKKMSEESEQPTISKKDQSESTHYDLELIQGPLLVKVNAFIKKLKSLLRQG